MEIPNKLDLHAIEEKWNAVWRETGIYAWNPAGSREETFVVDTPPPTVSGSLHVGHLFSYSQQDFIVRYQRMRGKNIFFPIGWDDNGLPTERRVQNLYNVRCEPHLPYEPDLKLERGEKKAPVPISRRNFIELCQVVTAEDEEAYKRLWSRLAMSYDWSLEYATIDAHCRKTSQASFLELFGKGEVYLAERPVMWDVDFRTAIAQAEVVDKEVSSAYHFLRFGIEGSGSSVVVATTRPELLPACVAVLVHPEDARYKSLIGGKAITPLFHAPVPILADEKADPEKGTGVVMVCTYGDQTDVEWRQRYDLPVRQVLDRSGNLIPLTFVSPDQEDSEHHFISVQPDIANTVYAEIQGCYSKQARVRLIEIAETMDGVLDRPREDISHVVRFYEKGDRPLEFIPTRQWFCRILDHKDALIRQGDKINWAPSYMGIRYRHWVEGLNQDWCLSRQRYFGVPIPMWYTVDEHGIPCYEKPVVPRPEDLPVDPLSDCPPGYTEDQRDIPGGFTGDPDVLDTWATSSLTPQIASHWVQDKDRHSRLFPMDIRPQAHEIIRTWAFYTITKAYLHENTIPWKHVVLSGWVLDPDRKKMSKSVGRVVTPEPLIEQFGADPVRYWPARARLGVDTAYDEQAFQVGKRLCTKLFNASRFAVGRFADIDTELLTADRITTEIDRAVIAELLTLIERVTAGFEQFDYAQALQLTEDFFWQTFCDNYLELAKGRTYEEDLTEGRLSAATTLRLVHRAITRLFAPFLPHLTEEVWNWCYTGHDGMPASVHLSPWPTAAEFNAVAPPGSPDIWRIAVSIIEHVRRVKAEHNLSMKAPVAETSIIVQEKHLTTAHAIREDIQGMLHIEKFNIVAGEPQDGLADTSVNV